MENRKGTDSFIVSAYVPAEASGIKTCRHRLKCPEWEPECRHLVIKDDGTLKKTGRHENARG